MSQDILSVLLLSIFTSANDIDLTTNSNYLFLLLLLLSQNNGCNSCNSCGLNTNCNGTCNTGCGCGCNNSCGCGCNCNRTFL